MNLKESKVLKQFKNLIILQNILGFHKNYLLTDKKYLQWLSYLHGVVLIGVSITYMFYEKPTSRPHLWMLIFVGGPYTLLVSSTILTSKSKLLRFYSLLTKFDVLAKTNENLVNFRQFVAIGIVLSFLIHILETMCIGVNVHRFYRPLIYVKLMPWFVAQELEQVFHVCNLRNIYLRLVILKLKIIEVFRVDKDNLLCMRNYKVEILHDREEQDISALHNAYVTLHKCSVKLNSAMKVSMLIILPTTGIMTIVTLNILNITINAKSLSINEKFAIVTSLVMQTVRLFISFLLPCYYCGYTSKEVSKIRSILYEVIRRRTLAPTNSIKVKSFLELIKDSNFTYKLLGAIKLDMSLPLRFLNVCFTYFMISLSFYSLLH